MATPQDPPVSPPAAPAPATPPLSKVAIFWRRLSSSVVLWAMVIGALFWSNRAASDCVFLVAMMVLAGFGLKEFYELVERRGLVCFKALGILGGLAMMLSTFIYLSGRFFPPRTPDQANSFETVILIIFVLGLCVRQFVSKRNAMGILAISTTLFGLMYVPWLLNFIQKISYFSFAGIDPLADGRTGRFYVLYFIAITKFSDLGAYAVGSLIGRHKMIPRISPGKTWEGFGGAIVVATIVSLLFARFDGGKLVGFTYLHAVILGIILSATAVIGDLIESLFKREAGVKDSGRFFPGIGGILDLMDSILFNAPLMYLYLRHVLVA